MSQRRKVWILSPLLDDSGPIVLGNIVNNYAYPDEACNENPPPPISPELSVSQSPVEKFELEVKVDSNLSGGIFANFIQMLNGGLGNADVSMDLGKSRTDKYTCEKLEKQNFKPSLAYVEEALKAPGVQQHLHGTFFNHPLYMITGIAIARGVSVESNDGSRRALQAQGGVDLTPITGVPVSIGPKASCSRIKEATTSFGRMSDFTLAYRLMRIKVDKKGRVTMQDYTKGALFHRNDHPSPETLTKPEKEDYSITMEDFTSHDLGGEYGVDIVDDDGEECECIRLEC